MTHCFYVGNPDQLDLDDDGIGDACDSDIDGDGRLNIYDNCPLTANPDQLDANGNGVGDVCERGTGDVSPALDLREAVITVAGANGAYQQSLPAVPFVPFSPSLGETRYESLPFDFCGPNLSYSDASTAMKSVVYPLGSGASLYSGVTVSNGGSAVTAAASFEVVYAIRQPVRVCLRGVVSEVSQFGVTGGPAMSFQGFIRNEDRPGESKELLLPTITGPGVRPPYFDWIALRLDPGRYRVRFSTMSSNGAGLFCLYMSTGSNQGSGLVEFRPVVDCRSDLNGDAFVDDADFILFLAQYNVLVCEASDMPGYCSADINRDGFVDDADFQNFVSAYDVLICS